MTRPRNCSLCRKTGERRIILQEGLVDDMRNQFEKQLQQLNEDLISMGALCKEAVADAMTALLYSDKQARQKTFLTEYEIDHKERDIESL